MLEHRQRQLQLAKSFMEIPRNGTPAEYSDLMRPNHNCIWLGSDPKLCKEAGRRGGIMSTTSVWKLIKSKGLAGSDVRTSDLSGYHIDHFVPKCKHGPDHPMDYVMMEANVNQHFGGAFSLEKCSYVGLLPVLAIIEFSFNRLERLPVYDYKQASRPAAHGFALPRSAATPVYCVG